jgi:hypothetical protein
MVNGCVGLDLKALDAYLAQVGAGCVSARPGIS